MPKMIDPQVRERAVRLVLEHRSEYPSNAKAIAAVARQEGVGAESLRRWVVQAEIDAGFNARGIMMPLRSNARAKMQGLSDGFIKLFCLPQTGIIVGGVVVAPGASELIYAVSLCVSARLTVDQASLAFTVYPSLSGSISEAGRRLHQVENVNEG